MTITTPTILPAPVQQWFDDVLLSRPEPLLIHNKMAMKKRLPYRSGTTVRYRRYNNLARATVPLGPSGVTPPPQTLSALDIDATISWYGTYVIVTDQVTIQNQDPREYGVSKSFLIDLEAYGKSYGDRAEGELLAA